MSVYVIVDDSDPNIIYSPRSPVTGQAIDVDNEADGWLVGGVGASDLLPHTIHVFLAAMAHVQSGGTLVCILKRMPGLFLPPYLGPGRPHPR